MIDFLNTFILLLLAGAFLLGTSALVQKRRVQRATGAPARTRGRNYLP